jgi:hypothetical protein
MTPMEYIRMAAIAHEVVCGAGPGTHAIEPQIQEIFRRCREENLPIDIGDVRREVRDMAGYP